MIDLGAQLQVPHCDPAVAKLIGQLQDLVGDQLVARTKIGGVVCTLHACPGQWKHHGERGSVSFWDHQIRLDPDGDNLPHTLLHEVVHVADRVLNGSHALDEDQTEQVAYLIGQVLTDNPLLVLQLVAAFAARWWGCDLNKEADCDPEP